MTEKKLKTNEEQTKDVKENKGFISRFGYIKTLAIVAGIGVLVAISNFMGGC